MTVEWRGKYLEVHVEGTWEYVARTKDIAAAVILAVTSDNALVLVEQWRVALAAPTIELPAGLIGDGGPEDAADSAARELEEETGFVAARLEDLGVYATSAGMSAETFHLFRAHGLERRGPGGGIDDEAITVHVVPLAELNTWLAAQRQRGCAIDCRLLLAMGLVSL